MATPFVRRAVAWFGQGDRDAVESPEWGDIARMLQQSAERGGRIDLESDSETEMTVFAEHGAFHITISMDECNYYFPSNGSEPTGECRDLYGHSFPADQILDDFALAADAVKTFWEEGGRSIRIQWILDSVEE
jgi:hypothetical protein